MIPQETYQAISRVAAGQPPGIYRWDEADAKSYRSYLVGEQSQVLLVSKAYRSASSRNQAQKKLQANAPSILAEEADGKFYFTVRNSKKKLQAVSPSFADADTRDRAMEAVQAHWQAAPAGAETETAATSSLRYSFRLDFYPDEDSNGLRGRITYPSNDSRLSFRGINGDAITAFIRQHLEKQLPVGQQSSVQKQEVQILPADETTPPTAGHLIQSGYKYRLQMGTSLTPQQVYDAIVTAKSLEDGQQQIIGRHAGNVQEGSVQIRLITDELSPGLYRFTASVRSRQDDQTMAIDEGSQILQVM